MPCNGFNHSPTCDCGWGGVWYGNAPTSRIFNDGNTKIDEFGSPVEASSFVRPGTRRKPESLTIPNARCPECGASVFFYQNDYGSRVFFDELGFDWPKHPCTDNSRYDNPAAGKVLVPALNVQREPKWREEGWLPYLIIRTTDDHIDLVGFDSSECLRLDRSSILNNVLPLGFVKKLSGDRLSLSYYHGGVRSRVTEQFGYKKIDKPNEDNREPDVTS
jgi:hypothetical protein